MGSLNFLAVWWVFGVFLGGQKYHFFRNFGRHLTPTPDHSGHLLGHFFEEKVTYIIKKRHFFFEKVTQ